MWLGDFSLESRLPFNRCITLAIQVSFLSLEFLIDKMGIIMPILLTS